MTSIVDNNDEPMKRRLQKALVVARNLKNQSEVEKEVNRELARRNEDLRSRNRFLEDLLGNSKSQISEIERQLNGIVLGNINEGEDIDVHILQEKLKNIQKCVSEFKESLDSVTSNEAKNIAGQHNTKVKHRRQSVVLSFSESDGTSLLRKSIAFHSESTIESTSAPTHSAGNSSETDYHLRSSAAAKLFIEHVEDSLVNPQGYSEIPLFEHFIMIGAPVEAADEFAHQLKDYEEDSISNRLKKTFGGILNTSKLVGNFMGNTNITPNMMSNENKTTSGVATNFFSFKGKERNASLDSSGNSDVVGDPTIEDSGRISDTPKSSAPSRTSLTPPTKSMFSFFGTTKTNVPLNDSDGAEKFEHRKSSGDKEPLILDTDQAEFEAFVSSIPENESSENSPISIQTSPIKGETDSTSAEESKEHSPRAESQKSIQMIASTTEKMVEFVSSTSTLKSAGNAFGAFFSKLNTTMASPDRKSMDTSVQILDPSKIEASEGSVECENVRQEESTTENLLGLKHEDELLELSKSHDNEAAVVQPEIAVNQNIATHIISADKRAGNAVVAPTVLFRYPPSVEPPPSEVCDFCLPLGGHLRTMNQKDEDSVVQEILLGHSHAKRSGKSFVFILDDKVSEGKELNEETGEGLGRLYGICVMVPRLVKTNVVDEARKARSAKSSQLNDLDIGASTNGDCYEFETVIIYDLITLERYIRMDLSSVHADSNLEYSRYLYEYIPTDLLSEALEKLARISVPRYGNYFDYQLSPNLPRVTTMRLRPPDGMIESDKNIAEWSLPPLLQWLPMETIIWVLSLLLTENKLIIVGHEAGMITSTVLGILVLLRPMEWISPIIPLLPTKLLDFVESPVPIVVGYTLNAFDKSVTISSVLTRCMGDSSDIAAAVLDVDTGDIFLPNTFASIIPFLCLPDADNLLQRLSQNKTPNDSNYTRSKPSYITTSNQKEEAKRIQNVISLHITALISLGKGFREQQQAILKKAAFGFQEEDDEESAGEDADEDSNDDATESRSGALKKYYAQMASADGTSTDTMDRRNSESTPKAQITEVKDNFIKLNQSLFSSSDHDGFMKRFVHTQMFEEAIQEDDVIM